VALAVGEPFHVPPGADDGAIEEARRTLEERLKALEGRACELLPSPQRTPRTRR
jgi:hypothetical protein